MVCISLQSLLDLSSIRIAYLMWTRRDVTKRRLKEKLFDELVDAVLSDVENLPLPEKTKAPILKHVRPAGSHLLSLLSLWHFTQPAKSQKCLTSDMLFECLILNADGLINQRKTAEKILSNRMLNNVFAFRLACINFLEKEVLKLWILVKEYFLNKLILEGEQANSFIERSPLLRYIDLKDQYYCFNMREYTYPKEYSPPSQFPFTTEREEVLFWISYCLSKENGISIKALPHFLGYDFDWYAFSLEFAAFSGNVACFDYFNNFRNPRIEYNYVNIIQKMFYSQDEMVDQHPCFGRQLPCFILHYVLLNWEEEAELFQNFPSHMLSYFLQWPLSLTFLDNIERLWKLFGHGIFEYMFELFSEPETNSLFSLPSFKSTTGIYSSEHLVRIWVALWNIGLDSTKSHFLDSRVILSIQYRSGQDEFIETFVTSGLKEKLLQLFLSNGEAILELYEREYLKDSLRSLVAKYMPEHFEDLDHRCISFLASHTVTKETIMNPNWRKRRNEKKNAGPIHESFWNYIKKYLFSSNRI